MYGLELACCCKTVAQIRFLLDFRLDLNENIPGYPAMQAYISLFSSCQGMLESWLALVPRPYKACLMYILPIQQWDFNATTRLPGTTAFVA